MAGMIRDVARVRSGSAALNPEIGRGNVFAGEVVWPALERDAAFLEAIDAVGDGKRLVDILLDHDDGGPLGDDHRQDGVEFAG